MTGKSSTIKNSFFFVTILLLSDFQSLFFHSSSSSLQIKANKLFLDEDDSYKLQINGNTIEDHSREYLPPEISEDDDISDAKPLVQLQIDDDEIDEDSDKNQDDNDEEIEQEKEIEENAKKSLKKKMNSIKGKLNEAQEAFGTKDKKAMKAQLKKMMKLLNDMDEKPEDSNPDIEVDDSDPEETSETKESSDDSQKKENEENEENEEINENNENDEKNDEDVEKNDEDADDPEGDSSEEKEESKEVEDSEDEEGSEERENSEEEEKPPANNEDFSILDSPNSDNENDDKPIGRNLRKGKNCKTNGQGAKAKNHKGDWDKVKIYDVSEWPDFCKTGEQQSPIRIQLSSTYHIEPFRIDIDYHEIENDYLELLNDGYKLFIKGYFGDLKYGDHIFKTKEIHLHHPSEHTFGEDELRTDMEIQIVNEDNAGMKIVVSLFLHDFNKKTPSDEIQDSQIFIRSILGLDENCGEDELNNLDLLNEGKKRKIPKNERMDLGLLINEIENYITYYGSLTTPPCTESVKWVIIRQKIAVH